MPTNLSVDPDLLDRALALSGERTKKAAVTEALQEFIARRQQRRLLELMGALEWDEGFDYKAGRSRRWAFLSVRRSLAGAREERGRW
jgi:Arc/MetJ family transcription regulator